MTPWVELDYDKLTGIPDAVLKAKIVELNRAIAHSEHIRWQGQKLSGSLEGTVKGWRDKIADELIRRKLREQSGKST